MSDRIDTEAVRRRYKSFAGNMSNEIRALCDEVDRLRAALRETARQMYDWITEWDQEPCEDATGYLTGLAEMEVRAALGDQEATPPEPRDEWRVVDDEGAVCCIEYDDLDAAHADAEMLDRDNPPDRHFVERAVVAWVREPSRFAAGEGDGQFKATPSPASAPQGEAEPDVA